MADMDVVAAPQVEPLVFPASFGQQRLWLLHRLEPESTAYTIPFLIRLSGPLAVGALADALSKLIGRHEVLRTTFFEELGEVFQRVAPAEAVRLDVIDVSKEPDSELAARELASGVLAERFSLAEGPLLRASLARLDEDEHLLILALHHSVADGWSMGVLKRDLAELYNAGIERRPAVLPELPVQYGDFAVWQRETLQGSRLDGQLAHWRRALEGAPSLLDLPTDRPRPPFQGSSGAHRRLWLDAALTAQLKAIGHAEGATLFMVLLAGLTALLSRYSDQDDIVVGTPVASRSRVELEDLIGFFSNTLALRSDLSGDPTFSELLRNARDVTLDAYAHQDMPFDRLVAELNPERGLGHAPIVQVLFALQHAGGRPLELSGLKTSIVELERSTSKFDLAVLTLESDEGLRLSFEYSTELFEADTIDRMLEHYEMLLRAALEDPGRRVAELRLLGEQQRDEALGMSVAVAPGEPAGCLHEMFADQVARAPDAPAVVHEGVMLTYGELDRRANQLAHRLRALGVGRDCLVALCLERSLDMIVAVVAVLKAGGAYVPMDPDNPAERLGFVLSDTGAPVLLTHEPLLDRLPMHEASVVCLDAEAAALATEPITAPEVGSVPGDLAYVIYTSGSTGRPKGVLVEHRNVARLFSCTEAWFGFGASDTWALLHSYAFDFSVWEMWGALLYGGKLVIPSHWTVRSPEALSRLLAFERVTVLNATPSLFSGAMGELLSVADRLCVRVVVFGGEALRPVALARWFEHFGDGGPVLVNMYGITETTVHVSYQVVAAEAVARAGSPIGVALPDLELHVLDAAGAHVPTGVPGEIYVGGAGVARGYLNRPELTAERFVANPFGEGRLYKSGDRARRLPGGGLDFLGRGDAQVKVRGYRIELGEIESALLTHDAVSETAVTALQVAPDDTRLAAYFVPAAGSSGTADLPAVLHTHVKGFLPPHMVPASIMAVDSLPLTSNGKLNRRALPTPTWGARSVSMPPRTPTEQEVADLWREMLDVERVGAEDSFFALGGHSLLAVRLFAEIEERLGVKLPLATLFQGDTVAELAAAIVRERASSKPWSPIVALRSEGSRAPLVVISLANLNSDFLPYRQLVEQLGSDQPVYGLQSPGMDGRTLPMGTVEELAAHYVRELRAFQPGGPHLLLGLAFAGMVAYEMARQLDEAGEPPVLLAMLNSAPYGRRSEPPLHAGDARTWRPWLSRRRKNLNHKLGMAYYEHLLRHGRKRPRRSLWDLHLMASSRARQSYVAPPTRARIDWFGVASERHEQFAARWAPLALGGVKYHPVVGGPEDTWNLRFLTRPHVDSIAATLRRVIDARMAERAEP